MTEQLVRAVHTPLWNEDRLATASVVIVGVGGLGTEVARLLTLEGVGRLVLCDPDVVEPSNLVRGALFRVADVGRPKVEAAAQALRDLVPAVEIDARADDFRYCVGLGELATGLVLSCLDSVADRITLSARCQLAAHLVDDSLGVLDAGLHPWGGEIRYYSRDGACYACRCSPTDKSMPAWHEACGLPPALGATAPVVALIAAWQAYYAIRLLFGEKPPEQVTAVEAPAGLSRPVRIERDEDCLCHGHIDKRYVTTTQLTAESTVGELLELIGAAERVLSWNPIDRTDATSTLNLAAADPRLRLREVGVPAGEILPVYRAEPVRHVRYLALRGAA